MPWAGAYHRRGTPPQGWGAYADTVSMAGASGGTSRPWRFLLLASLFAGGLWTVHRVPAGKYPAADRVRMPVAKILGAVTPAKAAPVEVPAPRAPATPPVSGPLRTV